jgi:hypothetical protein
MEGGRGNVNKNDSKQDCGVSDCYPVLCFVVRYKQALGISNMEIGDGRCGWNPQKVGSYG